MTLQVFVAHNIALDYFLLISHSYSVSALPLPWTHLFLIAYAPPSVWDTLLHPPCFYISFIPESLALMSLHQESLPQVTSTFPTPRAHSLYCYSAFLFCTFRISNYVFICIYYIYLKISKCIFTYTYISLP